MRFTAVQALVFLGMTAGLAAQSSQPANPQPPGATATTAAPSQTGTEEDAPAEARTPEGAPTSDAATVENRTSLNLLGQANTGRGESRRNENVQITLIDTNAARELNTRVGTTATIIEEFQIDRSYFSSELGNAPRSGIVVPGQSGTGWHGNLFLTHNNSIFSARSYFQVGSVQPARQNNYGVAAQGPVWRGGFFSVSLSQQKNRGQVNGNVLIPLPEERTPLATDPALHAKIQLYLNGYPDVAPNRPDIAARALNTNSPQRIDTDNHSSQLTQRLGARDVLSFRYAFTGQRVGAFQFVNGQNPNTATKSHTTRVNLRRAWSPRTILDVTVGFDRQTTAFRAPGGAVGPISVQGLTALGPPNNVPLDRAQNRYRSSFALQSNQGAHVLTAGLGFTRLQYNGNEQEVARGLYQFLADFGRDGITNLRLGAPFRYFTSIGTAYRAYRNWDLAGYAGDRWQARRSLTLNFGIRWDPTTRPIDVSGRSVLKYDYDWNNLGGTFGFAQRLGAGGVLRGAFAVTYGQIYPVTYGMDRFNVPYNSRTIVQTPDLVNPLQGVDTNIGPNTRSSRFSISPNLTTPYQYQYNLSWDRDLGANWHLQAGYVGTRSHKLFLTYLLNRAVPVPGIPLTTATVSERRPDKTAFEVLDLHNGSRAYYDAGVLRLSAPRWRGVNLSAAYWFSKAIDLGADYNVTGAGNGVREAAGQDGNQVHRDQKAVSDFHQPQAFLMQAAYSTGRGLPRLAAISRNWSLSTVVLLKTGTPFTIVSGSDGPGIGNVDGLQGDRPMLLDTALLGRTIGNPDTSRELLPRSAFRFIHTGEETAGNIGRNIFHKGKIANVNAALDRVWVLPHEWQVAFRAESINFFNTPQFAEPGLELTSPNFGQITNTLNDGRTFRLTLRIGF
jgi:hypothetical protein